MLAQNNYGKSGIRLVKIHRRGDTHPSDTVMRSIEFFGKHLIPEVTD